jgi:Domain of unknown function (DUF2427)
MLSISRSRYTLPVQFIFLILNGLGVIFSTTYNVNTPDLYENNAHHKIGWVATWVMTAHVVVSLLFLYSGRTQKEDETSMERSAFLPVSTANLEEHNISSHDDYRWSGDSGIDTARSSTLCSRDISPNDPQRSSKPDIDSASNDHAEDDEDDEEGLPMPMPMPTSRGSSRFRVSWIDHFLSNKIPGLFSARFLKGVELVYEIVDRTSLMLGFVALMTGGVTYAGIFVSRFKISNRKCMLTET